MAVYLPGCSDCLTGFCEPLSQPYKQSEKCLAQSPSYAAGGAGSEGRWGWEDQQGPL